MSSPPVEEFERTEKASLPRWQAGNNPQHILVTIMGDFWVSRPEYLPSAALVEFLDDLGVSADGARAALSRLSRRGVLAATKSGRNTFYRFERTMSPEAVRTGSAIMRFGEQLPWSGEWTLCAFSLPESRRETRNLVRGRLRGLGYMPVYDGLWASPRSISDETIEALDDLGIETGSVFSAREHSRSDRAGTASAWDLTAVEASYAAFSDEWEKVAEEIGRGRLSPQRAFIARSLLMDEYRRFLDIDPALPAAVLPEHWAGERARRLFHDLYDALAPLAVAYVQGTVARFDPDTAPLVHTHAATLRARGAKGVADCDMCIPAAQWPE